VSNTRTQQHNGITWLDLENPSRQDISAYAESHHFHALHLEECLVKGQLPQVEVEKDYIFAVFYFPSYNATKDKIVTSQVGVFLGKDYLLTVHEDSTPTIRHLFAKCEQDEKLRDTYIKTSPGYLLYKIVGDLIGELSNLIQLALRQLEELEDPVFDNQGSDAAQIGRLRHKIMKLRRITAALKQTLGDLSISVSGFTSEDLARHHRNNAKIVNKLWETVEEATETIDIYKDVDYTTNTEKTNTILAILTLLFTLTIPATVIGSFYGMNVLLPGGLQAGSWTFWGPYTTFILIMSASTLGAVVMYWYFKNKRWF
jgi:magnesium transporter